MEFNFDLQLFGGGGGGGGSSAAEVKTSAPGSQSAAKIEDVNTRQSVRDKFANAMSRSKTNKTVNYAGASMADLAGGLRKALLGE